MSEKSTHEFPCTECAGDAFVGYAEGWQGQVKKGERLCTRCFQKRGGKNIFAPHIDSDRTLGPTDWDRECQESKRLNR